MPTSFCAPALKPVSLHTDEAGASSVSLSQATRPFPDAYGVVKSLLPPRASELEGCGHAGSCSPDLPLGSWCTVVPVQATQLQEEEVFALLVPCKICKCASGGSFHMQASATSPTVHPWHVSKCFLSGTGGRCHSLLICPEKMHTGKMQGIMVTCIKLLTCADGPQ